MGVEGCGKLATGVDCMDVRAEVEATSVVCGGDRREEAPRGCGFREAAALSVNLEELD